jgi:hypothetical protein
MCTRQVLWKNETFFVSCVKRKKYLMRNLIAPNFIFLHKSQKIIIFHETTSWAHRMSRSKPEFLLLIFFDNLSFCWKHIQKRLQHMLLGAKTLIPFSYLIRGLKLTDYRNHFFSNKYDCMSSQSCTLLFLTEKSNVLALYLYRFSFLNALIF